jgi:malate dehydrogenase (oxaloacetate-decarboxylating)(NADP+)
MSDPRQDALRQAALDYHREPRPGKLEIRATKPLANGRDLARAYSARAWRRPVSRSRPTRRRRRSTRAGRNLVAVVSNGTAVLGLGNIGALASKPVMEGKAVLFKKFANIDCFDIELNEMDPREGLPISSARWSPPSARSTSRTSRHPTASWWSGSAGSG